MIDHKDIVMAFIKLGKFLREYCENNKKDHFGTANKVWQNKLNDAIQLAGHKNGWFTEDNIKFACSSWGALLTT